MSRRYQLWDKESQVITPIGEVLTAGQWMERYPAAAAIPYVLAAGEVNGAFCTPLGQMKQICAQQGCDFSACGTDQEVLDAIEAFEDAQNAPGEAVSNEELTATSLASIAASLEYQNMLTLDDAEVV
ncbi:hypothetical protein [Intestinimonas butyriciproducens]|uniref:hypothetical protein n=1 Tax=Intestinimonas butyriciproducens TaxID=1297617 RepID=UPI00051C4C02|nr:hypothetical protein [Intestinimonas butyriciproducens]